MPEPNQTIPILEGFLTGGPISEHDGVSCSPAMREATEEKYILKAISVPASESKLEAMLLAGAFSDQEAALAYYKDMAQDIVDEAALLQQLSRLEGFTAYENWQLLPKEDATGFCVYLLSPYRLTLERYLRSNPMTHLDAVNLGLDLCSALAVCRRSGYLYVDLKPSNIYICDDREFLIGDLGFIPLSSLQYASLPEKYHSAYTAPEIMDAYSALNDTLDIYAAGLVLYQVYNNGVLPQIDGPELLPPEYADYEMAAIILKACDPDPANRWQDPTEMGQALVAYMQKNTVNDTPIIPPAIPVEAEPEDEAVADEPDPEEPTTDEVISEVDQALESVGVDPQQAETELLASAEAAETTDEDAGEVPVETTEEATEEVPEETAEDVSEEASEEETVSEDESAADTDADNEPAQPAEENPAQETDSVPVTEESITAEVSQMLAQADDLIAHETPDPVVAPEPIDVPIPPKIVLPTEEEQELTEEEATESTEEVPEETSEEVSEEAAEEASEETTEADSEDEEAEDEGKSLEKSTKRRSLKALITAAICLAIAAGLFFGGYLYYNHVYLQHIESISLSGSEDRLTVSLTTDIEDSLLTVVCTDSYGNTKRQSVTDKAAVFTGLSPDTRYKVQVEIDGFHQLTGTTNSIHITQAQTSIINFSGVSGVENGSVILSFTVHGPDSKEWKIKYHALGEEAKSVTFTGHVITINGLALGKKYTFWLEPVEPLYIIGTNALEFTPSKLIYAENLAIQNFSGNTLTAVWSAPEGETVESWIVRCYNESGFDKTITVTGTYAVFEQLDTAYAYTVEVTAVGMTQGSRVSVSANPLTIRNLSVDTSDPERLKLSWTFEGKAPEGGWLLQYTVRDIADPQIINCPASYAEITPIVPGGVYFFTLQSADGNTVFNGKWAFTAPVTESIPND